jgi:hypothetical protein
LISVAIAGVPLSKCTRRVQDFSISFLCPGNTPKSF